MHVFVFILLLLFIFAIIATGLFQGLMWHCENFEYQYGKTACLAAGHSWVNGDFDFDNIGHALLVLFQVSTFSGWLDIAYATTVVTEVDQAWANKGGGCAIKHL